MVSVARKETGWEHFKPSEAESARHISWSSQFLVEASVVASPDCFGCFPAKCFGFQITLHSFLTMGSHDQLPFSGHCPDEFPSRT